MESEMVKGPVSAAGQQQAGASSSSSAAAVAPVPPGATGESLTRRLLPGEGQATSPVHDEVAQSEPSESGCKVTKYGVGVLLILLVAMIWVAASVWIQFIFGSLNYNKPFLITYFNTTMFSLWNAGFLLRPKWRRVPMREPLVTSTNDAEAAEPLHGPSTPYSLLLLAKTALAFCPLWFLANVLFNYSLSLTSVASNTILSNTSSIWTLFLSCMMLHQVPGRWKVAGLLCTLLGTTFVAFGESNSGDDSALGDIMALVSAFFYAAYTTTLKYFLPDENRYEMPMVFGFVGIINTLLFWPGFIILDRSGIEPFELPSWQQFWPLVLNTLIGTNLSDVLWAQSVILTSPFVSTMGLTLTIPLAMVTDFVMQAKHFSAMYITGSLCVTGGFVVANL